MMIGPPRIVDGLPVVSAIRHPARTQPPRWSVLTQASADPPRYTVMSVTCVGRRYLHLSADQVTNLSYVDALALLVERAGDALDEARRDGWVSSARASGEAAGESAAEWVTQNASRQTLLWLRAGIDAGDPVVLDTLPSSELRPDSDEFAVLLADIGAEEASDDSQDAILAAYNDGFGGAVHDAVEAAVRYQLGS